MTGLILPGRQVFMIDTHVNLDPTAEQLAELTQLAADQLCGLRPRSESGVAVALQLRFAAMPPRR